MLANYTLTYGYWKKISTAGQSGTSWLKSANGFLPTIKIAHTDQAQNPNDDIPYASANNLDINISYRIELNEISSELAADNENDIFYATVINPDKTCVITTDFVTL